MRCLAVLRFIRPLSLLGVLWPFIFTLMTTSPVQAQSTTICDTVTEIPTVECRALVALYESTNGSTWTHSDKWLVTNTPCFWVGIYCSEDDTVNGGALVANKYISSIDLPNNQLSGPIPSELGNLALLRGLNLSNNQLSGPIPSELGNLARLEGILLSNNQLGGSIPSALGNLDHLSYIDLSNNQLSGPIPPALGNLEVSYIDLSNNQLSGAIPAELSTLDIIDTFYPFIALDLSNNQLSGEIPAILGRMGGQSGHLTWDFSHNQLSGTLPLGLVGTDQESGLDTLDVSDNLLTGPLPADFPTSALKELDFTGTTICEPEDAAFQSWLFRIRLLGSSEQTCICDSANLLGVSTTECDGLIALFNATNGDQWTQKANWLATLDPCTWQGVTCANGAVSTLTLSDNRLIGRLPDTLGNLTRLTQLYLDNNLLTNVLPQRLTQLTQLTTFHFDDTLLCEPAENALQTWLAGIADLQRTSLPCHLTHFPFVAR